MLSNCKKLLFSGFFVFVFLYGCCNADQQIQEADLKQYRIVIPATPIPAEKTAAEELQYYLKEMTGVEVPVVSSSEFDGRKMIAVGFNNRLPLKYSQKHFEQIGGKFKPEEILIAGNGDVLVLAGGRPRGTIYAIYEYLHRLGVRWYSPQFTKVPKLKAIEFKEELYRYNPPIFSRTQAAGNAPTQQWSARNRINAYMLWASLEEKYGGGIGQGPDMHSFARIVHKSVLKRFPDWMAMVDGKREKPTNNHWGACLSNPNLRNYLINQTIAWAKKHPDRQCIWLGQNDGSKPCQCEKCKEFYKAHGGEPSSLIIKVTNELAARVEREFPGKNKIVKTLAYSWSLNPPQNIKPRDNVIVMFCAWGDYDAPLRTNPAEKVAKIRKAIEGWREIAKRLEVYLYCPPQSYWNARPAILPMCDNIKWAYESGVSNIYVQISGFHNRTGSDMVDLRTWVFARLCWDPSQDINMLIRDFCDGFYGPAGDVVYNAIMDIHKDVLDENHLPRKLNDCSNIPNSIDLKKLRKINIKFQNAYNRITNPIYKKHLSYAWLSFLWTDFWAGYESAGKFYENSNTWKVPMQDGKLRNHYAKLIKKIMMSNKVTALGELKSVNPVSLTLDLMGIPLKAQKIKSDKASAVVVPRIAGRIEGFADKCTGFKPFKPYWGFMILQYPIYGSTRELVNGGIVQKYRFVKCDDKAVVMDGRVGPYHVSKKVSFNENSLEIELQVKPMISGKLTLVPSVMLDLQDEVFGFYPTVHVETKQGQWTKFTLGNLSDFWYQTGAIDISQTTGRVVVAAEKSKRGLLLEFDPESITKLTYEYDRFDKWPNNGGGMVWFNPISQQDGKGGQTQIAKVGWTILADYELLLK